MERNTNETLDMNALTLHKGKFIEIHFDDSHGEMEFNVKLTFQYTNIFGKDI